MTRCGVAGFDDEVSYDLVQDADGFGERIGVIAVGVEEAPYLM